jgi:REP element-mobilizing transposase RayT
MRRNRSYLPGVGFHLMARTHCKEHYFEKAELRDEITAIIGRCIPRSDAKVIAFTIMSNHYHMIVRQGMAPLAQLMQPINREIALAVQRDQKRKGHVFQGRFRAKGCINAEQMREWIVYTHRNPVRAQLCCDPGQWAWSSHGVYNGGPSASVIPFWCALELFADNADGTDGLEGYKRHVRWRQECDALPEDAILPPRPPARFGDTYFARQFAPDTAAPSLSPELDLRDVVQRAVKELAPGLSLDDVRALPKTKSAVEIRRQIIERAARARHRTSSIARFLNVSETTVSRVVVSLAPRPIQRFDTGKVPHPCPNGT